ncbi:MAG: hypothetical protein MUE95_08400 [Cyclobacteriaceae bacterium]|jgi:hypothetical protein|nr:hypothetical protein [Cyclobacteriaceae bacterium]
MKRLVYSLCFLVVAGALMMGCDNGNADTVVFDSPPAIRIISPGSFALTGTPLRLEVEFRDGATEELSRSPLATATYTIRTKAGASVGNGTFTVSGIFTKVTQNFATPIVPGDYVLTVTASDTQGNTTTQSQDFKMIANFSTVGLIGSATAGGWDSDTPLTQDAGNPAIWARNSVTLSNGEAKFRANNNWTVNWGATGFPSGTGTQDGPNIPVAAGTYKVSIDITTGAYKFE